MSDVREKVARFLHQTYGAGPAYEWTTKPEEAREGWREEADEILALLPALPEEPSEEILNRASLAATRAFVEAVQDWGSPCHDTCEVRFRRPTPTYVVNEISDATKTALRAAYAAERGVTSRSSGNREGGA